jgi:hypothetical protein|tara:strand:+ start:159 stop:536 length:378 start_codon:yes stop_codon:yes gene_type:complete
MYSNSYSFYNNVYMANEKNKKDIFTATLLGMGILLITGSRKIDTMFSKNFFISLLIFSLLSFFALKAYAKYKYLAVLMFGSIFLLSPKVFTSMQGELFPITYIIFTIYFSIMLGDFMYKRWKSSL